jgi:hypothetical protein
MSTADAAPIQAVWEFWYIAMLITFVAAVTCALAAIEWNGVPGSDVDGGNAAGRGTR